MDLNNLKDEKKRNYDISDILLNKYFQIAIIFFIFFAFTIPLIIIYPPFEEKNESESLPEYYQNLMEKCQNSEFNFCCSESVKTMYYENLTLLEDSDCEEGYQKTMLRCEGSLKWCELIPS